MMAVEVRSRTALTEDIVALDLVPRSGTLPPFSPGAHIDVALPNGLVRQYSLTNPPDVRDCYQIAVLREPDGRGGSQCVHEQLLPGTALQVSAPRNLFALQDAPHALLLAGGIGITPLLCMARQLHAASASFALHYCGRSLSRMAFVEPLRSSTWADAVHLHCDDGDARQRLNAEALLLGAAADTHLYVCGPKGFMDHVLGTARGLGWPESRLHFESFSAQADASGDAFTLRLAKRNREIAVPSGVTALEALLAAGIDVPISCEQGVCGTCALPVLSGMPDHRDVYFTEAERAKSPMFTPCCSRSHSAVLELDY